MLTVRLCAKLERGLQPGCLPGSWSARLRTSSSHAGGSGDVWPGWLSDAIALAIASGHHFYITVGNYLNFGILLHVMQITHTLNTYFWFWFMTREERWCLAVV